MPTVFRGRMLLLALCGALSVTGADCLAQPGRSVVGSQGRDSVPSVAYFRAIEQLYKGNYRSAERALLRELKSSIKIGVTDRWVDAIAYHTMLGEVYYHQGRLPEALDQFDQACLMVLQDPSWMIRVDFQREPAPDLNRARQALLWGQSGRQFTLGAFSTQEKIRMGNSDSANRQAAERGGVVRAAQFWTLNVVEIVRATSLAMRRRNELLGPLGPEDVISRELATVFSRGVTIPNHWSKAWADLQFGCALAGVGKADQAEKSLQRALLIRGQYDHPLTGVALLELGRLKTEAGDLAAAGSLLTEASYSAFYYDDLGTIDEAFRIGTMNHLASGAKTLNLALEPALNWASRKRYDHLSARLSLALAEELLELGNVKEAQVALANGQSRLGEAAQGLLGTWYLCLDAHLQLQQGRDTASAALRQALQQSISMSTHNLQLLLANQRYDQQQLRPRSAAGIYQALLADPQPIDWILRPIATLARLKTPHELAFHRWLDAVLARKDMAMALEITDLAKRHRYHRSLAWGGRLAALRETLETPEHLLRQETRNQRNELLLRFPAYAEAMAEGEQLQAEISRRWQPGIDAEEQQSLVPVWRNWESNLSAREAMLRQLGLQRAAVDLEFPPVLSTMSLQKQLQPGQAIVVFHETPSALLGFLLTADASTSWQCAPKRQLGSLLSSFLRDLGNYDANHQLPVDELQSHQWLQSGSKLYEALLEGSSLDPAELEELIVVPDGLVWYVPFAALAVGAGDQQAPLISSARLRFAPTVGLAVGHTQPWRRVLRTGIVGSTLLAGETEEEKANSLALLRKSAENPLEFPESFPASAPTVGALTDVLVVLDEVELELSQPLAWSPLAPTRSSKQSSLSRWLRLPQFGPQRILLPGARTLAEAGGKTSKRKAAGSPMGTELFLASCGLMSTGAQTVLLSSWRVGGEATFELTREFLQELPYTAASAAWQRSVKLAMELPLEPAKQPRVKASGEEDLELSAAHPFFWAGYLLMDSGAPAPAEVEQASASPE